MPKFSEQQLENWTKPPSDSEEAKLSNSERLVREAIAAYPKLNNKLTDVFGQGSYANNTNVRLNSDIDINAMYNSGMYYELPEGSSAEEYGITSISYNFVEYKKDVYDALVARFGRSEVEWKDKCITVKANSYRVETDVVPTWMYKKYQNQNYAVEGCKFFSDSGREIINYPKQHIRNGISKNEQVLRRGKKLTRIHRKLRYRLIDENYIQSDPITSFLLECLVYNCDANVFSGTSWNDRLKQSIIFLYQNTDDKSKSKEWGEVSELLYLFHIGRKWTQEDVKNYMQLLWTYLEY